MGCYTGYLLRDEDGECRYHVAKWGTWLILDDAGRDEVVARIRAEGVPAAGVDDGRFGDWCCRGVAIDLRDRRYRCHPCDRSIDGNETVATQLRTAPAWAGWDAGLAWGGRDELAALIEPAARICRPYDLPVRFPDDLPFSVREPWFAGWDEERFELRVRDHALSADWYDGERALLTVVGPDRRVLDYRVRADVSGDRVEDLLAYLTHGPALLDALHAVAPYPPPDEYGTRAGAVIDADASAVCYWTPRFAPPRLLAAVAAAWPGWRLERLEGGLAGHRAATGRAGLRTPEIIVEEA